MALNTNTPFWSRIGNWIRTHRTRTYLIVGALLIAAASIMAYILLAQQPERTAAQVYSKPKKVVPPKKYYSPLTGEEVKDEAATKQAVTAIMIENSPDARPQSGVKQAGIVYEAVAEGGITRFLTLHQQDKPQMIGPVRSLRMYYVDWLAPYNASVAHVGGSAASLAEIRNGHYRDIDQFFNSAFYWRATDRYAPHNVYTSFEKLDALNQSKGYTESTFQGFSRTDGKPNKEPTAKNITINISGPAYNTAYTYDPATNTYARFLAGEPHIDREDGHITPSVIIALKVDMVHVMEDGYRESITTTGSGGAVIFQNGTAVEATWHKADRGAPLTFTDAAGKDIPLVRGQTWISAVPNQGGSITWE
ncbi:DUF3048 domain-containing protein [Streptomyces caniscabiei]|uniref:DUF3048 domain-containing protein n=1 Tax=Streptomyces caniscabiei TaxID=2746961 RepID=UPI0029B19CFF|nr:DUF3048 domain-containing protein [Streptomyces caniscabiei]MDX2776111.1 DUF3048 domain-containing protein [Streptomyces caniscabiei]